MRKKIMAFVFAAALLMAMAVPLFGSVGTAEAIVDPVTPIGCASTSVPAKDNSGGNAGGSAAFDPVRDPGGRSIPVAAAQGGDKAAVCP